MKRLKLILVPEAQNQFHEILESIKQDFGNYALLKYKERIDKKFDLIRTPFFRGRRVDYFPDLNSLVLSKQTTVIYKYTKDAVFILAFIPNRQNPSNTKDKLDSL